MVLNVRGKPLTIERFTLWLFYALVAGGAGYLWLAWSAGRAELREMCDRDVYPKVYKKASGAGYFDAGGSCIEDGCWDILIRSPFRFVEFENKSILYEEPIKEKGFFRATKIRIDTGLCDERVAQQLQDWAAFKDYYASGGCIQIEKLGNPSARYGLFTDHLPNVVLDNLFGSVIKRTRFYIKDMETSEIVAEQTNSMLFQRSMPRWASFDNMLHCRSRGIARSTPIQQVVEVENFVKPE